MFDKNIITSQGLEMIRSLLTGGKQLIFTRAVGGSDTSTEDELYAGPCSYNVAERVIKLPGGNVSGAVNHDGRLTDVRLDTNGQVKCHSGAIALRGNADAGFVLRDLQQRFRSVIVQLRVNPDLP